MRLHALALLGLLLLPVPARAWIFTEHRDLTAAGIARLDAADAAALEDVVGERRGGWRLDAGPRGAPGDAGALPGPDAQALRATPRPRASVRDGCSPNSRRYSTAKRPKE